jgi:hypothetical protein
LKNDLYRKRVVIINAGNKKRAPIKIVEGKKNNPRMNNIKP